MQVYIIQNENLYQDQENKADDIFYQRSHVITRSAGELVNSEWSILLLTIRH